jgi:transposase
MSRTEVDRGLDRRRRWTGEQKRQILAEAFGPGAVVTHVARRFGVRPGQIYRWRNEATETAPGFSKVIVAAPQATMQVPTSIEVDVGEIRIRIGPTTPGDLAACVLQALVCR